MKKIVLFLGIIALGINASGQGIKGVELGDYGLTSPMWGRSNIETTLLGVEGELSVEKFDSKIYSITFKAESFYKCDELAQALKQKYNLNSLNKGITGKWFNSDDENISIYVSEVQSGNFIIGWKGLVIEIRDKNLSKKAANNEKNQHNSDI